MTKNNNIQSRLVEIWDRVDTRISTLKEELKLSLSYTLKDECLEADLLPSF